MSKTAISLTKTHVDTSTWAPLEQGAVVVSDKTITRVTVTDAARRCYVDSAVRPAAKLYFAARGSAGVHEVCGHDVAGRLVACASFRVAARTRMWCSNGPYADLAQRVEKMLMKSSGRPWIINGKVYNMLVSWGRDHVHTLKAQKYFIEDVKSGLEYWLETQEPNGMVWDTISTNPEYPAPTWLGEALGKGWFWYDDNMKYIVRRIPVEADCEFLYTEGVWYAWKASGDDGWMAAQLPRLEKALTYNNSHPDRWSERHGLVRRSFCMDSWDFVNPKYCNGDHRCINPGDPQFLFHSDNSGLYSSYWRMAEMYEHLGNHVRARELRREGEALRSRANRKLFFDNIYGHMIPELLHPEKVYKEVGDERKRMSLSTGYTINRKLPTHEMAVKILKEYQHRGKEKKAESFAEWWTMDPPYQASQWGNYDGTGGSEIGEYMNGAICTIIAGELAKAAFDHGQEEYGADILRRVWELSERDGGYLYQVYKRLPEKVEAPKAAYQFVDISALASRGLRDGATKGVVPWTGEGRNDMRGLPTGKQTFGLIDFTIIDPAKNSGKAVICLRPEDKGVPASVTIPVSGLKSRSVYFLHCTAHSAPNGAVVGAYDVSYADGTVERAWVRSGQEIGHWWGIGSGMVNGSVARVAWRGANPTWKTVGMFMYGWNNPHPDKAITAIKAETFKVGGRGGGIMLGAISLSDHRVQYEVPIRSHGLPDCWAQASVYYGIAEGLAGVEDKGRAFHNVQVSPRWSVTGSAKAEVTMHYPSSDGYCSYAYRMDAKRKRIELDLTGSFEQADVHCLLPAKAKAVAVTIDGASAAFKNARIEQSNYVDFALDGLPKGAVVIQYR
jgi:hypothetical protein